MTLTTPSFIYREDKISGEYKVKREHEMRVDLLFQDIYNLEPNEVGVYLENIDILLYINNIDNPLSIKEGMILKFPNISNFGEFRISLSTLEEDKLSIREQIIVPNKSTRKDKDREKFKSNNYSLPPVVLETPRAPVRISNGKFSVGGI